jgi:GTP-binding protein Era
MTADELTRAGFAALIGAPNAGKSTLTNALIGQKVSIVTHKIQTTRFPVRGVMLHGPTQIVLVDTPGVFAPKSRLDRAMVTSAWGGAADADAIAHIVDAPALWRVLQGAAKKGDVPTVADTDRVSEGLRETGRKAALVLNKIDQLEREHLLTLVKERFDETIHDQVFMVSAKNADGIDQLANHLAAKMPAGPWLYPEDQVADLPMRLMAAEITREALFNRLHQELPYASTVETEDWKEKQDGSVRIEQNIYVERESQRKIALGKDGQSIKAISKASREELERLLERPVHLFVFVKIREKWRDERARFNAMGLNYDV